MDKEEQILLIIALVILVTFWGYVYIYTSDRVTDLKGNVHTCGINQCATNSNTGIKRECGNDIPYDIGNEVCNSTFFCDNPLTTFAELSDASTITSIAEPNFHKCQDNIKCNCLKTPQCSYYATVMFQASSGNLVTVGTAANRTILNQVPKSSSEIPVKIIDPNLQSCIIGHSALSLVWPKVDNGKCIDGSLVTVVPDIFTGVIPTTNARSYSCVPPPTSPIPICPIGTLANPVINYLTGLSQWQCLPL